MRVPSWNWEAVKHDLGEAAASVARAVERSRAAEQRGRTARDRARASAARAERLREVETRRSRDR
jgi:hypothetical protein